MSITLVCMCVCAGGGRGGGQNVANDILEAGDALIAWRCKQSWDEEWIVPANGTPGPIKAALGGAYPARKASHLCATAVSNTIGRWTLPWRASWTLDSDTSDVVWAL